MYDHHPLVVAARYGDAGAEEHGLEGYVKGQLGIEIEVLMHVASQRALRLVLLTSRGAAYLKSLPGNVAVPVPLTPPEEAMMERFMLAVMDGISVGWRGHGLHLDAVE